MRYLLILLLSFYMLPPLQTAAQERNAEKITARFDSLPAPKFLNAVEKIVSYRFYYDNKQLDSVIINLDADDLPVRELLEQAFKSTDIRFSIDSTGKNIFISKKFAIVTKLPTNIFNSETRPGEVTDAHTEIPVPFETEAENDVASVPGKLYEIGRRTGQNRGQAVITGYVRNSKTGEPLPNITVFTDSLRATTTDAYGYYSLTVPSGNQVLNLQAIGMEDLKLRLLVYGDGHLDADMNEQVKTLKEVVISNRKTTNIRNTQMGVERLSIEAIRNIPTVFGESDVLRVVTSLPGVKTVGEASTGFNVRGGSADQNLILFNDAVIFNPSHFFGLFSAFNPDVVQDVELYKSSVPAKYGGRLSSVLDITSREGNKKQLTGTAGIGVVTSRLHLEGPLSKDKTSFILGARSTYANWLMQLLPDEYENSRASFQDLNLSVSHQIDSSNNLYVTGYYSHDRFKLVEDTTYSYSNRNMNIKWKHNFTNKFRGVFLAAFDQYVYNVSSERNKVNAFRLGFKINQLSAKADFDFYHNLKHSFDFGVSTLLYKLHPGYIEPDGGESVIQPEEVQKEQALESGIYLTHRYSPGRNLSISTGLRYSMFNYLGPQEVNTYIPGEPLTATSRTGSVSYKNGAMVKTYHGPELRISARYIVTPDFSVKLSYNSLRQYIHLLSNTTLVAPTDIWKLSDPNIRPQKGEQVSLGFYKNFKSNTIETSLEIYYKKIKDYLDYKPGATLFLNHHIETDVLNTKGKAYGLELLLKKPGGKLNGWISYTWSRIMLKGADSTQGVQINNGDFYPANYDKPHDITLAVNFRINHRVSLSLNSTYSTGRPITLPIGRYYYAGSQRVLYSDRNAYRIQDYYRTDFALNIEGNHKITQKTHNSWTVGIYNLLGRKNPYSVYFISEEGRIKGYKLSIFGSALPFINYNIRF